MVLVLSTALLVLVLVDYARFATHPSPLSSLFLATEVSKAYT